MSSSGGTPISYRPQVNRAISKRWAEAKQISYEGSDWGDDNYYEQSAPSSARAGQQSSWPAQAAPAQRYYAQPPQQGKTQATRNFTNPSPSRSAGRQSSDPGDERRNFSAHTPSSSFESPFPEAQHDFHQGYPEPSTKPLPGPPPLHIQTPGRPQSRDRLPQTQQPSTSQIKHTRLPPTPYQDPVRGVPYGDDGRRSESGGRPSLSDLQGRPESPYRAMNPPMSARSQHSRDESPAKRFPPRKSSLSQDNPILEPSPWPGSSAAATGGPPASESPKPLPFIRPADIYKRMEEEREKEREKERRSQESSRPSIDSNASRPRERDVFTSTRQSQESSRSKVDTTSGLSRDNRSPARAPPSSSQTLEQRPAENESLEGTEDVETTRKLKSTLDPVAERKSEYGFENMLKEAGSDHPSSFQPTTSPSVEDPTSPSALSTRSEQVEPLTAISASSNYSERPDLATASSPSPEKSSPHVLPVFRGVSDFGTDFLNQSSAQRGHVAVVQRPVIEAQNTASNPLATLEAPASSLQGAQDVVTNKAPAPDSTDAEMHHNPSIGLRSVVHQGFDDSQDQVPQTPLSTNASVMRSDSASASEISPIISRATSSFPAGGGVNQSESQHPSIAEAMDEAYTTPLQSTAPPSATVQETGQTIAAPEPAPPPTPPLKDGYRRDYSIPSPGNSQARTPLTVRTAGVPEGERASKSSVTPTETQKPRDIPLSASTDFQDMEGRTKSTETKAELKDSPLPSLPTTSSATGGSSTRGTVRELAEKLESRSGRASPAVSLDREQEIPRPSHIRLESFRPSLPGGWQSYSKNTDAPSQQQEQDATTRAVEHTSGPASRPRDGVVDSPVSSEDDEMPTAGPPKPRRDDSDYGPSKTAFAAAAAAGSALVGAFTSATGLDSGHNEAPHSYEVSEDESMTTDPVARDDLSRRGFGDVMPRDQAGMLASHPEEEPQTPSPIAPSPPAKDAPGESDTPGSMLGYFPLPLRTNRTAEPVPPIANESPPSTRPPTLPVLSSDTTIQDRESDRLHEEIVRSLTPQLTHDEGISAGTLADETPLPQISVASQSQSFNLATAAVPELNDGNTSTLNMGSGQTELSRPQTPIAPIITDQVLPQPQDSVGGEQPPLTTQAGTAAGRHGRPMLGQRFSWERQTATESPVSSQPAESILAGSPRSPQKVRGETGSPETTRPGAQPNTPPTTNLPRIGPLMAPADTLRHVQDDAPSRYDETGNNADAAQQGLLSGRSFGPHLRGLPATDSDAALHASAREMPFRDILLLSTPQDRIRAFNTNRGLAAGQETGLGGWLKAMGNQLPEHSDILRNNGRLSAQEIDSLAPYRPSPARSKFQRMASLANNHQSTDPEYDPSISNSPSAGKGSNLHMPGQGKKLLKDAGKIGGQAGVVAKGLFAKGKNKLRPNAGSGDKGILAGRRRSSQPVIVIDEPQHSSASTTPAPQIPNLNISPIESGEHWYTPIDAASSPVPERSVPPMNAVPGQGSNNRDLMLPDPVDRLAQQARQSSPRVSAIGSLQDGELPSRSISEVTRPTNSGDERSPIATILEDFAPSTVTENITPDGSTHSRLLTAVPTLGAGIVPTGLPSAPVSDALGPLPDLSRTAGAATNPLPTESNFAEQPISPGRDVAPKGPTHETGDSGPASDALATTPSNMQPAQPTAVRQGSDPPSGQVDAAMPVTIPVSNSEDVSEPDVVGLNPPNKASHPSPDDTSPPYTEPNLSKAAEAALYRSQVDPSGDPADDLPAYQSTRESEQNTPKTRVGKGDIIVPVADLSHQRQSSSGPVQSRPFSFVAGDTIISRGNTPVEPSASASDAPPIQPDLAKETSIGGSEGSRDSLDVANRKSKSSSRPLVTDPDVRDHPAHRQSQDMARIKETFVQSDRSEDVQPMGNGPSKTAHNDGQYRIPGPYVQEYRSPKQPPQALMAKQPPTSRPTSYEQPPQRPTPGIDPLRSHHPHSESQMRPQGQLTTNTLAPVTGVGASPVNDRPRQHSKGGLFRKRSKSRSVRSRNEETQSAENKSENQGGFFKQRTKADGSSVQSQPGNARGSSGDGINRQMSREGIDPNAANGERRDQVGDLRNPTVGNPLQHDVKKKRFSGFGSLFGRAGASATKKNTKPQGSQPVQRASTLSHILPGKPDSRPQQTAASPDTMYAQNHQRHQMFAQAHQPGSHPPSQHGYQNVNPPIGGYYAPGQQQQARSPTMPHDPDSFSRSRFSAEQQTHVDQYPNLPNQGGYQGPYQPGARPFSQPLAPPVSQPEDPRPPLQINTNTNQPGARGSLNHHLVTAPPVLPPQFPPLSQPSTESPRHVPYYNSQRPNQEPVFESRPRSRSPYTYGPTQATTPSITSHVIDLHKRSRSPRNGRKPSGDERLEEVNRNDPASQLGTFSNVAAPRSGGADSSEQAAPWRIGLPNSDEDENTGKGQATLADREREQAEPVESRPGDENAPHTEDQKKEETEDEHPRKSEEEWRKQEQVQHEPTVAEKLMGVQLARAPLPLQGSTSAGNAMAKLPKMSPVELPGSKAPGDDSDDEIVMSSTAYPGQEWAPDNWGYGGNWED